MKNDSIPVGGDFSRIFDSNDWQSMVNTPDEAACVLRGHLILEEFIHLWIDKVTNTSDMFANVFVPFKMKLVISRNLGLEENYFQALDYINNIRNRFGHRKGYTFELSEIESLADKIDSICLPEGIREFVNCREFSFTGTGVDGKGIRSNKKFTYYEAENRLKFFIVFSVLMLKLSYWLQYEFENKGIEYTIIKEMEG